MKRPFTLIELLIGFSLLTSIGGLIGWRVGPLIQKKQFANDVARLQNELVSLHQLAVSTQSDWSLAIEHKGSGWTLKEECVKTPRLCTKHLKPIESASLAFNDKAIDRVTFTFYATGLVLPEGNLTCTQAQLKEAKTLSLSKLFQQERQ